MKTASVRDLRQNFPRILEWINSGEEVTITRRNQSVARLTACSKGRKAKRQMPDIAARLKRVFGERIITGAAMKALTDANRRAF
jgi:antitoxin (DNA-binding transcriptional repressor) of toxin-antitoxin stability system